MGSKVTGELGLDITEVQKMIQKVVTEQLPALVTASQKATESLGGIEKSSKGAADAMKGFGSVINALGIGTSLAALVAYGKELLNFGKATSDAAAQADLSIHEFEGMKEALMNFVGAEDASHVIESLAESLRKAKLYSDPAAISQFRAVGVSLEQLQNPATNANSLILKLASGYTQAGDKADYVARLSLLLGDDVTRRLVPALQAGSDKLGALNDSAVQAGDGMDAMAKKGELALERLSEAAKNETLKTVGYLDQFLQYLSGKATDLSGAAGGAAGSNAKETALGLLLDPAAVAGEIASGVGTVGDGTKIVMPSDNPANKGGAGGGTPSVTKTDYIATAEGQAAAQTRMMQAELDGQRHLLAIEKIRAEYALKIKDAQATKNGFLVNELQIQQRLATLASDADSYNLTPAQRFALHKDERKGVRNVRRAGGDVATGIAPSDAIGEGTLYGPYHEKSSGNLQPENNDYNNNPGTGYKGGGSGTLYGAYNQVSSRGDIPVPSNSGNSFQQSLDSITSITVGTISTGAITGSSK